MKTFTLVTRRGTVYHFDTLKDARAFCRRVFCECVVYDVNNNAVAFHSTEHGWKEI
jgi:hypothetical protein